MRLVALILLVLLCTPAFPQQAPAPAAELDRVERTLQTLADLKTKVAAIETQIDQLIAELSEQKGAIANRKPAAFGGMSDAGPGTADPAKPKAGRCAAITSKGDRCTRPSVAGGRYCRQHLLAHQK